MTYTIAFTYSKVNHRAKAGDSGLGSPQCVNHGTSCAEVTSGMHGETMIQRLTIFHQSSIFYMDCDVIFHTVCQPFLRKLQSQNKSCLPLELLMKNYFWRLQLQRWIIINIWSHKMKLSVPRMTLILSMLAAYFSIVGSENVIAQIQHSCLIY